MIKKIFNIGNFLLIIVILITIHPLLSTGMVVNDDLLNQYSIYKNGFLKSLLASMELFKIQGRVYFLSFFWIFIPYAIKSFSYFKIIQLGSMILSIVSISILTAIISNHKKSFFLTFLIGLIFLQNSWEHNAISAFPNFLTMPLSILIFSIIFLIQSFRKNIKTYYWISVILYIITLFSYEIFILFLPIFFFINFNSKEKRLVKLKRFLPFFIASFSYLIIYLLFRLNFGSSYGGAQIQNNFNLINSLKVIWNFSLSSFPLFLLNTEKYRYIISTYNDSVYSLDLLSTKYLFFNKTNIIAFIESIQIQWLIKSLIVFYLTLNFVNEIKFKKNRLLVPILLGVLYFFIPSSLHSLTQTYQDLVVKNNQIGMPVTYVSYVSLIATFSLLIVYVRNKIKNNFLLKIFIFVISFSFASISIVNDYTNFQIAKYQTMARYKWETIDNFIKSKEFNEIPEESTIYAPSLWHQIGSTAFHETYWTDYITYRSNKLITVVKSINTEIKYENIYYLKYDQKTKDLEQNIVFADISKNFDFNHLISEKVCVYNFSKYNNYYIFGETINKTSIQDQSTEYEYFNIFVNNIVNDINNLKKTCFTGTNINVESIFILNETINSIKTKTPVDLIIEK